MSHIVIYVPGLGDSRVLGRRLLVWGWRLYGVRPVVHQMNWADGMPFEPKFTRLLQHIDELTGQGHQVSLVGESAGASTVINAYAARQDKIHRVACICGKLRNPGNIHPSTYQRNPAFAGSMQQLAPSLARLSRQNLERIRSVMPLADNVVPVADTLIDGAQSKTIPSFGHATSIVLGDTVFSYIIVGFLQRA